MSANEFYSDVSDLKFRMYRIGRLYQINLQYYASGRFDFEHYRENECEIIRLLLLVGEEIMELYNPDHRLRNLTMKITLERLYGIFRAMLNAIMNNIHMSENVFYRVVLHIKCRMYRIGRLYISNQNHYTTGRISLENYLENEYEITRLVFFSWGGDPRTL